MKKALCRERSFGRASAPGPLLQRPKTFVANSVNVYLWRQYAHKQYINTLDTLGVSPSGVHWLYWMELCLRTIGAYRSTPRFSEGTTLPVQPTRRAGISCRFSFAWKTAILGSTYFHANENPSRTAPCTPEGLTPSVSRVRRKK